MRNFWKDVRFALRTLGRNPGFAIIAVVTLALGMAVNTTLFSVVNGPALRMSHGPSVHKRTMKMGTTSGIENNRFTPIF